MTSVLVSYANNLIGNLTHGFHSINVICFVTFAFGIAATAWYCTSFVKLFNVPCPFSVLLDIYVVSFRFFLYPDSSRISLCVVIAFTYRFAINNPHSRSSFSNPLGAIWVIRDGTNDSLMCNMNMALDLWTINCGHPAQDPGTGRRCDIRYLVSQESPYKLLSFCSEALAKYA